MKGAANGTHHGHGRGLCLSLILMLPASGCLRLPPVYHSGASRAARHVPKSLPTDGLHHRRVVVKAAVLSAMACASRPAIAAAPLTTDRSDVREWSVAFLFTEAQLWETPTFPPSTFQRFAAAGAAAHVLSELVFLPIYTSKTLAQCDPDGFPEGFDGIQRVITDARGDWRSLFRAWDMTLLSNLIYGGLAFGCTELFERALREVLGSSSASMNEVPLLVLASFCASALAALAYSPFEALRIRVITACALAGAEDPGIVAAFQQATSSAGGRASLLAATWPLVLEEVPYTAGTLILYDLTSTALQGLLPAAALPLDVSAALAASLFAGSVAGALSALLSHPINTVVVRMCEGSDSVGAELGAELGGVHGEDRELSFWGTLRAIVQREGVGALFAGARTSAAFHGVIGSVQFCLYEAFKRSLHVAPEDLMLFFDGLNGGLEVGAILS